MPLLSRYILRQVAGAYGLASLLLLGLFGFFDLSAQLDDVGKGVYSTGDALVYTLLGLPQRLVELMPFTALLASVAALGIMVQRRELVIMRSIGISPLRLAGIFMLGGMTLAAINIGLQSSVAPALLAHATRLRAAALAGRADTGNGYWIRAAHSVVHIAQLRNGRIPQAVEFYDFGQTDNLVRYVYADHADVLAADHWRLHDAVVKRFSGTGVQSKTRALLDWHPALYARQLAILSQPPAALSPLSLYRYIDYLHAQHEHADIYRVALWQKMALPLTTLSMMLFAIPLSFANPRGANLGLRLIAGGLIGLVVYAAGQASGNLALVFDLHPAGPVLATPVLFIGMALAWLRRLS